MIRNVEIIERVRTATKARRVEIAGKQDIQPSDYLIEINGDFGTEVLYTTSLMSEEAAHAFSDYRHFKYYPKEVNAEQIVRNSAQVFQESMGFHPQELVDAKSEKEKAQNHLHS